MIAIYSSFLNKEWNENYSETNWLRIVKNRMLNELFHEVVPVILHEDDLNAILQLKTAHLSDRKPFETFSIPEHHLIQDGIKNVLRVVRSLV